MRALFINPWIYDFAAFDLWSKPLGLLSLAGYLRQAGWDTRLLDCLDRFHPALPRPSSPATSRFGSGTYCWEEIPKPAALKKIPRRYKRYGLPLSTVREILRAEERPDIILITSGMTYWYPAVRDMIALVKTIFPGVPTALGGNYVNLCHRHAAGTSGADYLFRGTSAAEAGRYVGAITGDGSLEKAAKTVPPRPAYELYHTLPYVTLKTSHGCPFTCTYCGWHLIDGCFSAEPPEKIVEDIGYYYHALHVRAFAFYDDALLYKADRHFLKIASRITAKRIRAAFLTPNGLHNRFLTREVARRMMEAGFVRPRLALETTSERRQRESGGKTSTEDFLRAVRNLTEAGYTRREIGVSILIGLPGQAEGEIERSARFAADEGLRVHLEEYSPIPGTADYEMTGLAQNADPLLHNNSVFSFHSSARHEEIQRLKDIVRVLNAARPPEPSEDSPEPRR